MKNRKLNKWMLKASVILSCLGGEASAQRVTLDTGLLYTAGAARQNGGARIIKPRLLRYQRIANDVCGRSSVPITMRNRVVSNTTYRESSTFTLNTGVLETRFNVGLPNQTEDIARRFRGRRMDLVAICAATKPPGSGPNQEPSSGQANGNGSAYAWINGRILNIIPRIIAHEWGHCMKATHAGRFATGNRTTVMGAGNISRYSNPDIRVNGVRIGSRNQNNAKSVRDNRFRVRDTNGDIYRRF